MVFKQFRTMYFDRLWSNVEDNNRKDLSGLKDVCYKKIRKNKANNQLLFIPQNENISPKSLPAIFQFPFLIAVLQANYYFT